MYKNKRDFVKTEKNTMLICNTVININVFVLCYSTNMFNKMY